MKYIELSVGKKATVCDCHYGLVKDYKWSYQPTGIGGYAIRGVYLDNGRHRTIRMHRVIAGEPGGQVDHIDNDKLNNQCSNLRLATAAQNAQNKRQRRDNKSGHKGVCWYKRYGKWRVQIGLSGKPTHIGYYSSLTEAICAYKEVALTHYGEFANVN